MFLYFQKRSKCLELTHHITRNILMWNMTNLPLIVEKLLAMWKFSIIRYNSKIMVKRSKHWYPQKTHVTRNTHVKYQNFSTHGWIVICNVKVSDRNTKLRKDRMTDRTKKYIPDLRSRVHKNVEVLNCL